MVITLLAILLIWGMGNIRTLDHLGRSVRLLDQTQRRAWASTVVHHLSDANQDAEPASSSPPPDEPF